MSLCQFTTTKIDSSLWRHACATCGESVVNQYEKYNRACPKLPQAPPLTAAALAGPPSLARRIKNFTKAAIAHAINAAPTCGDGEIARRHAICRACELYEPSPDNPQVGTCQHPECGCCLDRDATYLSKLAWADQSCPLKKWLATTGENHGH